MQPTLVFLLGESHAHRSLWLQSMGLQSGTQLTTKTTVRTSYAAGLRISFVLTEDNVDDVFLSKKNYLLLQCVPGSQSVLDKMNFRSYFSFKEFRTCRDH